MLSQSISQTQRNSNNLHIAILALGLALAYVVCSGTTVAAQSCPSGTFNVTSYGATGNGTTDDTTDIRSAIQAAMQAAINSGITSGPTSCVYFPQPTNFYKITSSFVIGLPSSTSTTPVSGVTLYGDTQSGQNVTMIKYFCSSCTGAGGYPMFKVGSASPAVVSPNLITIENLILDGSGDGTSGTATAGVQTYQGTSHTFHSLTIQNFIGNNSNSSIGIHLTGPTGCNSNPCTTGTTSSHINNNTISNIGTNATGSQSTAGIRCSWGSNGNSIQNNMISNVGRDGIAIDDYSTNAVVKYNTISGTGMAGGSALGVEILIGSDRAQVDGNNVDHWISIAQSSTVAVRHNTVVNNTTTIVGDIGLEFAAGNDAALTDGIFTWNTVGPATVPMNCGSGGNQTCGQQNIGMSISNTVQSAFPPTYSYWASNKVQNMQAENGNTPFGVQINSGNSNTAMLNPLQYHYFYGNTVQDTPTPGHGFRLLSSGSSNLNPLDYIVLDSNIITNNGLHGTCPSGGNGINFVSGVNADYFSAVNNTISNNRGDAVAANTFPAHIEWSGGTVSGNCNDTTPSTNPPGWTGVDTSATFTYSPGPCPPTCPSAGQTITFKTSYTGSVSHVMWDFDDGIPVTSSSLQTQYTYKYPNKGTCTVTLIIWDASGVAWHYSQPIEVGGGTGNCNAN